jgi:multidrug transporter EmrE-like cation transporter
MEVRMASFIPIGSIVFAAILNATASSILKYASTYRAIPDSKGAVYWLIFTGALALFGGSFPFYAYGLSKMKLSVAQPIFSVGSYVALALIAFFFFKDSYSPLKIAGLIVIIGGVLMVANG